MKKRENSLAGQSVLDVDTHERADEVFCFFADVVPVGGVELELSCEKVSGSSFPGERGESEPRGTRGDRTLKTKFLPN